jgi:hypothetical protein
VRRGLRFEAGLKLSGRYRLDAPIGAGGMGEVWQGLDLSLRRRVAIKILPADLATQPSAVERFRREAETTAALQHPGITVIFDIGEHEDEGEGENEGQRVLYLVMELLTGSDLQGVLQTSPGGLEIGPAVSLVAQAADALAAAHSRGVVHRDIKPANLFLLQEGRLKICDFGIARLADATTLTASGAFIGTPLYMAPEQFRGLPLDPRADLYSLGCVLYELLAGSPPFDAGTGAAAIMYQHLNEEPAPLRSRRPEVPESLERLTLSLLAKSPADRPMDAASVAIALRGQAGDQTVPGRAASATVPESPPPTGPQETVTPFLRERGRRRTVLIGAAIAAAAALIAGGAYVLLDGNAPAKPSASRTKPPTGTPPSDPRPVVPGWQVMLAPGYGVAYDLPPAWKMEGPGTFLGFEDASGNGLAGERAPARLMKGKCTRAQSGLKGGSDPAAKPTAEQLLALRGGAEEEARKWASAAYGEGNEYDRAPKVSEGETSTITAHGITAGKAVMTVTPMAKPNTCAPARAVVATIGMAATRNPSAVGPLYLTIFADRSVPGQATDDEIDKIIGSLRPYHCPPGTSTHDGDNKCSVGPPTPG